MTLSCIDGGCSVWRLWIRFQHRRTTVFGSHRKSESHLVQSFARHRTRFKLAGPALQPRDLDAAARKVISDIVSVTGLNIYSPIAFGHGSAWTGHDMATTIVWLNKTLAAGKYGQQQTTWQLYLPWDSEFALKMNADQWRRRQSFCFRTGKPLADIFKVSSMRRFLTNFIFPTLLYMKNKSINGFFLIATIPV